MLKLRLPVFALIAALAGCDAAEPFSAAGPDASAPASTCGNGQVEAGEACDDGAANSDTEPGACRSNCHVARCGDAVVDEGEDCDDGINVGSYDQCSLGCKPPTMVCGDGVKNGPEACDDGVNDGSYGSCSADCLAEGPRCGDGLVSGDEACDDGKNDASYGSCVADCSAEGPRCGDAKVNGDEACDDGVNDGSYGGCSADCLAEGPRCGDGVVSGEEACDDGKNDASYGSCVADCSAQGPRCGDAEVNGPEACDDGVNDGAYDGCATDCSAKGPHCGDAEVSGGEACDDGVNDGSYGGCEAGCVALADRCGDGKLTGAEACDDGVNDGSYGGCSADCLGEGPRCGDGLVSGDEACDDGVNDGSYGSCVADCSAEGPHCGDGAVNGGEVCDDGVNDGSYGGCMTGCLALGPRCGDGAVSGTEACDDGVNDGAYGGCEPGCAILANHCGDAKLTDGELCDDGLNDGTYGSCSADCLGQGPRCGDALVSGVEDCDDGVNDGSYGHCPVGCVGQAAYCNDGKTDSPDEACDDGVNNGKYDYCAAGCQGPGPHCGDALLNGIQGKPELCDDGVNDGSYGHCRVNCAGFAAFCGDGVANGTADHPEDCDDGTNNGKYGKCSADCSGPGLRCGDGVKNGPEVCDNGADNGSYGNCKADCTGMGPRCGDAIKNGLEACDDGTNNGSYGGCAVGCGALGPRCGDGVKNGPEECDDANADNTDDCSNACKLPAFLVTYDGLPPDNAPLNQKVEVFFSRTVDAATLVAANISVKAGGVPVELKFLPSGKSVELQVARWEPNTTYTITIGMGVKDAWGNALPAVSTRTFATANVALTLGAPLATADYQSAAVMKSPGAYSPISAPHEYVLLGADTAWNGDVTILDHKESNTFPEQVPANSWNAQVPNLRNTPKRAVRARLDADVRDEVAVVARPTPDGPLELMVIDPTPTLNGTTRGTSFSTKVVSSAIGPIDTQKVFDVAAGQWDSDPYEEIFVLVGGGFAKPPANVDGKLRLYVFDDAAANYALLKTEVLKSHAYPITGVSLAVGDVDRDGTDEIAVAYNVNVDSELYGWQHTKATLYKRNGSTLSGLDLPFQKPEQNRQEYNPAQMLKVAIVNVDDDPSQREVVVSSLLGGKDYWSSQALWFFRYAPGAVPPVASLAEFGIELGAGIISTDDYEPHPDKVLLPVEINAGSQKELLLMDGSIRRFDKDPFTQERKLTTLINPEPAFRFDPFVSSVAVGEIEARTFNAGKAEQDHRSDEIVILKNGAMVVWAIDEKRGGDGSITGYQLRYVNHVPSTQVPGAMSNALLVLADVDHDGIYGKFVSRTTKLSENHIIALIAAPPCYSPMEGCSSEIAFGESHSGSNEISGTAAVTGSVGVHVLADAGASVIVGASMTVEEIDVDLAVKVTAGFSYSYTKEYTKTITYGTTRDHMVVFSTTPYEIYNYDIVSHPNRSMTDPDANKFFIAVPNPPAIYSMSKTIYDKQINAEADKVKGILASTPGNLASYGPISSLDNWRKGKDVIVDVADDQKMTTPKADSYGASFTTTTLGVSTTSTFTGSLAVEEEISLRTCTMTACIGGALTFGAGYAFSYSFTDSVEFSGTLGNVLKDEPTYEVQMTPHRVRREMMLDHAVTQDFLVLDYLVDPPAGYVPPSP